MRIWWAKLRNLFAGEHRLSGDLREEMRAHLEFEIEDRIAKGVPPEEARAEARRRFGNATAIAERTRDAWTFAWLDALQRDVRLAFRSMRRRSAFTAVAVLSLAIALGANTAVFSFANPILLRTLPVAGAERLVILGQRNEQFHMENCCFAYDFFRVLRRTPNDFEDVLAVGDVEARLTDREQTERLKGELVSGNYFRMLGIHAAAGRLLEEADDATEGAGRVCVISHRLWQERFGGDPGIMGRRVLLNKEPFQIVGVTDPGFDGASLHDPRDFQVPSAMAQSLRGFKRGDLSFFVVARLKPGVPPARAEAWLNANGRQMEKAAATFVGNDFLVHDGSQGISSEKSEFGKPVLVLLLLVATLLLVACANLAALLLVRSVERTREAGMRAAIGASRFALFRQFAAEAAILSAAGGLAGWAISLALTRLLLDLLPPHEGFASLVRPDAAVFAFCAAATLAAALLFGLFPALRASRADPLAAIQGSVVVRPGRQMVISRSVIAAQIALSLTLLFCAGLFAQTLRNLRAVDLGFHPQNLIVFDIDLSHTTYSTESSPFFTELLRRVRELPETRAASLANLNVVTGTMWGTVLSVPGSTPGRGPLSMTYVNAVSDGYFRSLATPLLAGRDLVATDGTGDTVSVVVNEQFANQFFGGAAGALDRSFVYGGDKQKARIIGVTRTTKFQYLREQPKPVMYMALQPAKHEGLFLQLRTSAPPAVAIQRLHAILHDMAPRLPFGPATTMEMQIDAALSRERLLAFLSTLLGAVAAALAAIGLYGVLSFAVTRRTREIGIRLSIGAPRARILALFLKESAWVVVAGAAAGIPLMLACGHLAVSLLYGLHGQDAATIVAATGGLALIALLAALIPATRAARVNPVQALRHE